MLPSGVKEFFYRYRTKGGDKTLALVRYDFAGKNGKTLADIRRVLREKRDIQESTGDVKEHLRVRATLARSALGVCARANTLMDIWSTNSFPARSGSRSFVMRTKPT